MVIPRADTMAPNEIRIVSWDFTAELASGETIVGQLCTVYNNPANQTTNPTISTTLQARTTALSGNVVTAAIAGGVFGQDYIVTFTAFTSAGQVIPRSIYQFVGQT